MPRFSTGPVGGNAIEFNGGDQALDYGELPESDCLGNLDNCPFGLTISFNLRIVEFRNKMYIFSSGGDSKDTSGVSMWWQGNRLYLRLATSQYEWTCKAKYKKGDIVFDTFVKVEFTWSVQSGLRMFLNSDLVDTDLKPKKTKHKGRHTRRFYIGRRYSKREYAACLISDWNVVFAEREIVKTFSIDIELPKFSRAPELSLSRNGSRVELMCTVSPLPQEALTYYVMWYKNGQKIVDDRQLNLTNGDFVNILREEDIGIVHFNDKLSCSVYACEPDNCGPARDSAYLTAQVKLLTKEVTVWEGAMYEYIEVISTIPPRLFCSQPDRDDACKLFVQAVMEKEKKQQKCPGSDEVIYQAVFGMDMLSTERRPCQYEIRMSVWRQIMKIPIRGSVDGLKDKDQKREVKVTATVEISGLIYSSLEVGEVKVTVKDRNKKSGLCRSTGDPHSITFDGRYFDNYLEGEFTQYRHKNLPFEVHSYQRKCRRAACLCSVSIKSGDDVIVFDQCGPKKSGSNRALQVNMYMNGDLTPGTIIRRKSGGAEYTVTLPTGGMLRVKQVKIFGERFLNLYFKASAADFMNSEGLCGTFDDDKTNDLTMKSGKIFGGKSKRPNEFIRSWRVTSSESHYNGICPEVESVGSGDMFCTCMEGEDMTCSNTLDVQTCQEAEARRGRRSRKHGKDITESLVEAARTVDLCVPRDVIIWEFDITFEAVEFTWPVAGITREMAEERCRSFIEIHAAAQACKSIITVDFELALEGCVADIQISGGFDFLLSMFYDIVQTCSVEIEFNADLWIVQESGVIILPEVTAILCDEDCGDNGKCEDGECKCNEGWLGPACDIDSAQPPVLLSLDTELCDTTTDDCDEITIYGFMFVESDNLICHFKNEQDRVSTQQAVFVSQEVIRCPLSISGYLQISVSNDGTKTSNKTLLYRAYDSLCETCHNVTSCSARDDVCKVDSKCFADGFFNPENPDEMCNLVISSTVWTPIRVDSIEEQRLTWQTTIGNILVTSLGNITTAEGVTLTRNTRNRFSLELDGRTQFLDLSGLQSIRDSCVFSPSKCRLGFSFLFTIKFLELEDNTYILTNGGDLLDSTGLSVYYRRNRLYITVSTRTQEWTVYIHKKDILFNRYQDYEISWSLQHGLSCSLDGRFIRKSKKFKKRNVGNVIRRGFFFGRPIEAGGRYARCVLEQWQMVFASKEVTEKLDIPLGYPKLLSPPKIETEMTEAGAHFMCRFSLVKGLSVKYDVAYYVDEERLLNQTVSGDAIPALNQTIYPNVELGSQLYCVVAVCLSEDCEATRGEGIRSPVITLGIQILTESLTITEGSVGHIDVRATIPPSFFCPASEKETCVVKLHAGIRASKEKKCPDKSVIPQAVLSWQHMEITPFCGLVLQEEKWQQNHSIVVKGVIDGVKDKDQVRSVSVWATVTSVTYSRRLQLGNVKVTVKDMDDNSVCMSVNDPHIYTFDKRKYNNFFEGEFVFAIIKDSGIKIHTFYRSCNKRASCNCAVAVKVDDDVILFDKCGAQRGTEGKGYPMTVKLYKNGDLTPGLSVYRRKNEQYNVYLPNGFLLKVKVQRRGRSRNFINVYLTASAAGYNKTEGLCGVYDGNKKNDLLKKDGEVSLETDKEPNIFSQTWRVSEEDSLYDGFCGVALSEASTASQVYCDCVYGEDDVCARGKDIFSCDQDHGRGGDKRKGKDITQALLEEAVVPLKCTSSEPRIIFQFDITYVHKSIIFGITEFEAADFCRSQVQISQSARTCKGIIETKFNLAVDFCVEDLLITGNFTWMEVSRENIKELCTIAIERNTDLWLEVDGETQLPAVIDAICPNECSNNGNCTLGNCECNTGYAGPDCSINLIDPPRIFSVKGGLLCDTLLFPCNIVTIYGFGFAENDNLTCNYQKITSKTTMTVSGDVIKLKAVFVSQEEVKCKLPSNDSYEVSVSNNGDIFSDPILFVVFSSVCETCTERSCNDRDDICVIDGNCYEDGFTNPSDESQICSLDMTTTWKVITGGDIIVYRLSFVEIIGDVLKTTGFNLILQGAPDLVRSVTGGLAIQLNGVNQSMMLVGKASECIGDVEKCTTGLTVSFKLKFLKLTGNEVDKIMVFSSGADNSTSYGMAMWYSIKSKQLCLRVSTSTKEWTVCTQKVALERLFDCKFSWSIQKGLKLWFDGKVVATQTTYIRRTIRVTRQTEFYIGRSASLTSFAHILLEGWNVAYTTDTVAEKLNLVTETPSFEEGPEVSVPSNQSEASVSVYCTFRALTAVGLQYQVMWYVNDTVVKVDDIGNNTVSVLAETGLGVLSLDSEISCGVSACYENNCNSTRGAVKKSETLKTSVKVSVTELTITEGSKSEYIRVTLLFPPHVYCPGNQKSLCSVRVNAVLIKAEETIKCGNGHDFPQALIGWTQDTQGDAFCGVTLTSENWLTGVMVPVRATLDGLKDKDQQQELQLLASLVVSDKPTASFLQATVLLTVIDRDKTSMCSATGDPHIETFDGRKFNVYLEGEFILYKHKFLPVKVTTFFRPCNKRRGAACVCAVMVMSGDDVIVIDKCGKEQDDPDKQRPIQIRTYINGELTPGTKIFQYNNGKKTQVTLMTGGYVTVQKSRFKAGTYLDVWIRASSADFQQTEGLCGYFDDDRSNDLMLPNGNIYPGRENKPDSFSNEWRASGEESLTYGTCGVVATTQVEKTQVFCSCLAEGQTCSVDVGFLSCSQEDKKNNRNNGVDMTTQFLESQLSENPPKKCLSQETLVGWEFDLSYVAAEFTWPTPNNITYEMAVTECSTYIRFRASAKACESVVQAVFTAGLESCVEDIQIMDDLAWAASALGNILVKCETKILFDLELWETTDGVAQPPAALLRVLCPGDCSNHGNCSNGVCICEEGYSGDDCSISLTDPPTVYAPTDPTCDTRLDKCLTVVVYGDGFANTGQLRCWLEILQMEDSGSITSSGMSRWAEATYISSEEVRCNLNTTGIYNVSVSVSETITSGSVLFLAYDSVCFSCLTDACSKKEDICFIDNACYGNGFVNVNNPVERCLSGGTSWVPISQSDIVIVEYIFLEITNNRLVTKDLNIPVIGNPTLVQGLNGVSKACLLNGEDQYIDFSNLPRNCLWNPTECSLGFTIGFNLKIREIRSTMTIFSNGGEESTGYGVAMYIRDKRFYCTVSTTTQVWTVTTTQFSVNTFFSIEFSWSIQTGLSLYFDGKLVSETMTFIRRNSSLLTVSSKFYVGKSVTEDVFAALEFEYWNFKNSTREIAEAVLLPSSSVSTITPSTTILTTSDRTLSSSHSSQLSLSVTPTRAQTNPSSDITSSSSTAAMSTQAPTVTSSSIDTTNTQTVTSPSNTRSSSDVSTTPSTQVSTIISTTPTSTADVDTHTSSGADTSLSPSPTSAVATASPSALPPQSTSSVITSTSVPSCAGAASNLQMTQRPTLTYSSSMTKVTFSCRVQKVADTGVTYTVKWVVGSTILKTDELNDRFYAQLDSSSLSNEERNNILAKGIGCNATASTSNCQSSELTSEQYYHFQFKVTTPGSMQLIEGLSVNIGVDMGIRPDMYCPLMYGEACTVYAEAAVVAMNSRKCVGSQRTIDPLVIKSAGFSVENAVCGARMSVTTASISLHSVLDRISHVQDTNVTVNIYQRDRVGSRDNITLIKALEITIIDRDMENALCGATADPHLTTFDLLHYDVMLEGEFIMYRHTELETEVRIYMRRVGLGSGVCGTSIRSGNDVIQINKCDIVPTNTTEKLPLKVKQYFRKTLTPRTKIYQEEEGNTYRILLPCGSKVTVSTLADIFMNVWVEPSAWVIGRSQGLCGIYDGDKTNDLTDKNTTVYSITGISNEPLDFAKSWRVSAGSYYDVGYEGSEDFTSSIYCSCSEGGEKVCGYSQNIDECSISTGVEYTQELLKDQRDQSLSQFTGRRKRQTTGFQYDPNYHDSQTATWPTASGTTEEQARTLCTNKVRSAQLECANFDPQNYTVEIQKCVQDIKLTDNQDWSESALQDVQTRCLSSVSRNAGAWEQQNNTAILPRQVLKTLCPGYCTGNGTCDDTRKCVCNDGYRGPDCSLPADKTPTLNMAQSNSVCNLGTGACNSTVVNGNYFKENSVYCHLVPITIDSTGITSRGSQEVVSLAVYRSASELVCTLPVNSIRSYSIKVSNDQMKTSTAAALFVVNKPCSVCSVNNTDASCTIKAGSNQCLIDGECYAAKAIKDSCTICEPGTSTTSWTSLSAPGCPTLRTEDSSRVVIGISVGIAVAFLIAIIVTGYFLCTRRQTKDSDLLNGSDHESGGYHRTYDGNYGLRTEKQLSFYNTTARDIYEPTL